MTKEELRAKREHLLSIAASCKRDLADAATGPLKAACALCPIIEQWDTYREAAGDICAAAWLSSALGSARGGKHKSWAHFLTQRYEAVTLLGKDAARKIHHEVAVWLVGQMGHGRIDELEWRRVKKELYADTERRGRPLTPAEAKRLVAGILQWKNRVTEHACARCAQLEARLREMGAEV